MPILLAIPFVLLCLSKIMFQAPKQAALHFLLAYQYLQAGGTLDFWQNILSYGEDIPFWAMIIYFGIKRRSYQDHSNFALLDGAKATAWACAAYQLYIMYWATQLCHIRAECHSPAQYWSYSPLFLIICVALGIYFTDLLNKASIH